jgi:hypothetical protein
MITINIHAGIEKTGSSALQAFLNFNREILLRDHSCLYPDFQSSFLHRGHTYHNHCLSIRRKEKETIIENIERSVTFCRENGISKVILSCESFFNRPDVLERIVARFKNEPDISFRIIIFFRRQDHLFEAGWKQWGVKDIRYGTISEFIEQYMESQTSRWLDNLKRYSCVFGKENIIIHAYEKEQMTEGLIPLFLNMTEISYAKSHWITPPDTNLNTNDGFTRDILEILALNKSFNKDIHDPALTNFFYSVLPEAYKKKPYERYDILSPAERIRILKKYAGVNQTIAKDYLGRDDGILFYEPWPNPDDPWKPYEGLTLEKIVPVFFRLVYSIHGRYNPHPLNPRENRVLYAGRVLPAGKRILHLCRGSYRGSVRKNLVIHIGAHKTGSTAIQRFLSMNRDLLENQGFLYPGEGYAHHDLAREFRSLSLQEIMDNPDLAIHRHFREIEASDAISVILSCETFEFFTQYQISTLKHFLNNKYNVRIIYYIRRQDNKIESAYNESVKNGGSRTDLTFLDYLSRHTLATESTTGAGNGVRNAPVNSLDYYAILTQWSNAFGKTNVSVHCYEEEQLPGGIFQDFIQAAGLSPDRHYRIPEKRINERLSWDLIEMIRLCNAQFKDDKKFHNFLVQNLIRINSEIKLTFPHLLSPQQRRDLISLYEESNGKVAREYLGRSDGRLFYSPLPDPDEPWAPYEGLTAEKVVPVFIRMVFTINNDIRLQKNRNQSNNILTSARVGIRRLAGWKIPGPGGEPR